MTRSRIILSLAAATVGLALAYAPAVLADDMSHPGTMNKSDHMEKKGMKKDSMSKDGMKKDGMKKDDMKKDDMTK